MTCCQENYKVLDSAIKKHAQAITLPFCFGVSRTLSLPHTYTADWAVECVYVSKRRVLIRARMVHHVPPCLMGKIKPEAQQWTCFTHSPGRVYIPQHIWAEEWSVSDEQIWWRWWSHKHVPRLDSFQCSSETSRMLEMLLIERNDCV